MDSKNNKHCWGPYLKTPKGGCNVSPESWEQVYLPNELSSETSDDTCSPPIIQPEEISIEFGDITTPSVIRDLLEDKEDNDWDVNDPEDKEDNDWGVNDNIGWDVNDLEEGEIKEEKKGNKEKIPSYDYDYENLFTYNENMEEMRLDYYDLRFYTKKEFNNYYMDNGAHWKFQNPKKVMRRQLINDIVYYNRKLSNKRLDILIDKMIAYAS
jgi:hypothetical protein